MVLDFSIALSTISIAVSVAIGFDVFNNPLQHTRKYRIDRARTMLTTAIAYVALYSGRYNISIVNNEHVRSVLGVSKGEFGAVLLSGFWTYAIFQVLDGRFADLVGGKKALTLGCLGSGIVNFVTALLFWSQSAYVGIMCLFFLNVINNMFQPFASVAWCRVTAHWFDRLERGHVSGMLGTVIGVGYFSSLTLGGWLLSRTEFWVLFAKPAVLLILMSILVYCNVRDSPFVPQNSQAPTVVGMELQGQSEVASSVVNDSENENVQGSTEKCSPTAMNSEMNDVATVERDSVFKLLQNKRLIGCCFTTMTIGWAREGFLSWFAAYFEEEIGEIGTSLFIITSTGISVAGMTGSLIAGQISDHCFHSRRPPVVMLFQVGQALSLCAVSLLQSRFAKIACLVTTAFFIFGPLSLIVGSASADFAGRRHAGMASGMLNFTQYIGSGLGSYFMGRIIEFYGWRAWGLSLSPAPVLGLFFMLWVDRTDRRTT